jgi:hypothetical protein
MQPLVPLCGTSGTLSSGSGSWHCLPVGAPSLATISLLRADEDPAGYLMYRIVE